MAGRSLRDELLHHSHRRTPKVSRRLVGGVIAALVLAVLIAILWWRPSSDSVSAAPDTTDGSQHDPQATVGTPTEPPDERPAGGSEAEPADLVESELPSAEVRHLLNELQVVQGRSAYDYDRGLFGQTWFDQDRNGCDTRNDMLRRDLENVVTKAGTNDCKVLSGTLEDWYSGLTVEFVSGQNTSIEVQIDHVVPLAWAWHHGADVWNDELRREFANDPLNLAATTAEMNQSKSDSGPSRWLPAFDGSQCRYVELYTAVLHKYDLGIGLRDRAMIRGVLEECDTSNGFGQFSFTG